LQAIIAFEETKKFWGALQKIKQLHFTKSHLYEKNVQNGGASLNSNLKARAICFKFFRTFGIV